MHNLLSILNGSLEVLQKRDPAHLGLLELYLALENNHLKELARETLRIENELLVRDGQLQEKEDLA